MTIPKCFISYSWDSNSHKKWVRYLAEKIRESGVEVILDQWHLQLGSDLTRFMEEAIRDSDCILLICTPNFAKKSNAGIGGVGYEKTIVTGEIFQGINQPEKFVPILRLGTADESLPSYLKSKVFANFTDDRLFNENFLELLRHIHKSPAYSPPPIGPKPISFLSNENPITNKSDVMASTTISIYCDRCGAQPGSPSRCPGYSSHRFVSGSGSGMLYCDRCGAQLGNPSKCPGYSSHRFVLS